MKRVGLFGGTFDPPHIGHLIIASEVQHTLQLDEVWFIPTYSPPHKEDAQSTVYDRLTMLKNMIDNEPGLHISKIEIERKGLSYTIDTINALQDMYKHTKFHFIIGADMVASLHKWKSIDSLIKKIDFVGVSRKGFELSSKYPIITVPIPLIEISSTNIRRRIKHNLPFKYFVHTKVYNYIKEQRLYGYK